MLVSGEFSPSAVVTGLWFRFVLSPLERDCRAALVVFSSVAVHADSLMGDVVDFAGELWVASLEDDFWELGGVSGRLLEMWEEMLIGL